MANRRICLLMKQVKIVPGTADELDPLVVLEKAISFFRHYGKLVAGVALAGMLAAALFFWQAPKVYNSSMVMQPVLLTSPEQMEIVNNWSTLLKKKEYLVLSEQWQVNEPTLRKLRSISVEELQKTSSVTNYTAYSITVKVTDTTILPVIQKGMFYALDHGEYIKDKLASRKNILQSLIKAVNNEISRLQAMQSTVEKDLQTGNHAASGILIDVSSLSEQIATMQEKKLNYEESLRFTNSAHVLQNFYTPGKAESRLLKFLFIGLATGTMLGGALSLYIHVRRTMKIRDHEK